MDVRFQLQIPPTHIGLLLYGTKSVISCTGLSPVQHTALSQSFPDPMLIYCQKKCDGQWNANIKKIIYWIKCMRNIMASSNENIFRVTGHLCGVFTGHRWMFSLICAWLNGWVNNREGGALKRQRAHYDVKVMKCRLQDACHFVQVSICYIHVTLPMFWYDVINVGH